MKSKKHIALFILVLIPKILYGNSTTTKEELSIKQICDYTNIQGEQFTFAQTFKGGEKYGYQFWGTKPDTSSPNLSYENYVGKSGKLTSEKLYSTHSRISFHRKAVLENCEEVYIRLFEGSESYNGIYFESEILAAKKLISTTIWVNNTNVIKPQSIITESEKIEYQTFNTEPLTVTGIVLTSYGHSRGSGPFFIKVRKNTGEEGLLKFNNSYFYDKNPIPKGTPKNINTSIQQQKIQIGMNQKQVILSWGNPDKVNKSVGPWGVHEQWVYESRYLYFKNGHLSSFQSLN